MSDYSGSGVYELVPMNAQDMSLNVWGGAQSPGTQVKLYPRTASARNTQFAIVAAGGTQGKAEKGDREYLIIACNSGLYVAANDAMQVTTELRSPLDLSVRWKLQHAGNGAFYINNVGTGKQLNVRGGYKESGTEIITYMLTENGNAQFVLKAL
ncbi:ricin B lectin domain-containing protein [Boeremia exigua]|uniref:ricin B lectin domain-containing protein n=1 Tax=Boeremia exigua TaxID=749465 RepID=UPI001E8CDDB5|nr:ricin B lectin domain-containing protein [Boeremia exigua]KAH6642393.1 ricin B lectin domain-containing protein [Boeremia exigua]